MGKEKAKMLISRMELIYRIFHNMFHNMTSEINSEHKNNTKCSHKHLFYPILFPSYKRFRVSFSLLSKRNSQSTRQSL